MKEFETEIMIISCLRYAKDDNVGSVLTYSLTDPELCKNSDNFVGGVPVTEFFKGAEVFKKIHDNLLSFETVTGHFKVQQDFKNPLKYTNKLDSVTTKDGNVISLL